MLNDDGQAKGKKLHLLKSTSKFMHTACFDMHTFDKPKLNRRYSSRIKCAPGSSNTAL